MLLFYGVIILLFQGAQYLLFTWFYNQMCVHHFINKVNVSKLKKKHDMCILVCQMVLGFVSYLF